MPFLGGRVYNNMDKIGLFITKKKKTKHAFDVIVVVLVSRLFITHVASFHVLWIIVVFPWIEISLKIYWKWILDSTFASMALWNISCLPSAWCSNSFYTTHAVGCLGMKAKRISICTDSWRSMEPFPVELTVNKQFHRHI